MDSSPDAKTTHPKRSRSNLGTLFYICLGLLAFGSLYSAWSENTSRPRVEKAVVVLSGPFNVTGIVTFYQRHGHGPVTVSGDIKYLDPDALRGFHVHQAGDLTDGCLSAGPHFNPFGKTHGAPTDKERHVGDLGNIQSNSNGAAIFSFEDGKISLNGRLSIIGRAVVVHAGVDDLGQGGNDESLKTGNAGARAACGVIGLSA